MSAAYLPEGVSLEVAEAVVGEANRVRPNDIPFSILVSDANVDLTNPLVPRLQPRDLIRYRQDDRLAVVHGRVPEIASFVGAFRESLNQSFPDSSTAEVSLESLAQAVVVVMLDDFDIAHDGRAAAKYLYEALTALKCAYQEAPQGARSWNAGWFLHASRSLAALEELLANAVTTSAAMSVDDFFAEFSFAAFGLPRPDAGYAYRVDRRRLGRRFADAFTNWWSGSAAIAQSLRLISHSSDAPHPLESTEWDPFDSHLVVEDSHIAAWNLTACGAPVGIRAMASLTEAEFFNPLRQTEVVEPIVMRGLESNVGLGVGEGPDIGPFALRTTIEADRIRTEQVRIPVAVLGPLAIDAIANSHVKPTATAGLRWVGRLEGSEDGRLEAVGHFERSLAGAASTAPVSISIEVSSDDALFGRVVPPAAPATALLIPSGSQGLVCMKLSARGSIMGRPSIVARDVADEPASGEIAGQYFDGTSLHRILIWSGDGEKVAHESHAIPLLHGRAGLHMVDVYPQPVDVFRVGNDEIKMRSPEPTRSFVSPLVAAAHKQQPSEGPLAVESIDSFRGRYEAASLSGVRSTEWLRLGGHVIQSSSGDTLVEEAIATDYGVLMPAAAVASWREAVDARVSEALLKSDEAERFRSAFRVVETLAEDSAGSGAWPSRTSRASLWTGRREALEEYLASYVALIEKAASSGNDPFGIFWATYPFSVSVWDLQTGECGAVYLSPLHPIRLAWLSGAEHTLREARRAIDLMGAIEGWNFPAVGPSETRSGRMVAIPSDNGAEQLFLGWSVLVRASTDRFQPLQSPSRVGALAAPGTTASGLNASTVSTALRNYRRMNPHVAGITVDLAASRETARLREVDDAVVSALREWGNEDNHLIGGARILDATNRVGPAPLEGMTRLIRETPNLPLVWSRYEHVDGAQRASNIRILQDSGARVCVYPSDGADLGVVGDVPLRRFEAVDPSFDEPRTVSRMPGLRSLGWRPFTEAVRQVESRTGFPRIAARLNSTMLTDANSDWTVSGEAMLSPSAMAAILADSGDARRMLWEWRPPVFDKSSGNALLERRPYVTVARVPQSFRYQLRELLTRAQGFDASESDLDELLSRLGARGVGLSSLLSMGGTHASGALGFSLGFALMDSGDEDGHDRFVLSIDACYSFLKSLAGDVRQAGALQRADLLIIDMTDDAITLVPIEIKFYGLGSDSPPSLLPDMTSGVLDEPFSQLSSTMTLLRTMEQNAAELRGSPSSADSRMWLNALASLIDAGARLRSPSSSRPDGYVARLQRLLDGEVRLRTGRPLLAFFSHDAHAVDGSPFRTSAAVRPSEDEPSGYGVLASNSATAFAASSDAESSLAREWRNLVTWALAEADDEEQRSPGSSVGSGTANEHSKPPESIPAKAGQPDRSRAESNAPSTSATAPTEIGVSGAVAGNGICFDVGAVRGSIGQGVANFWPSNTDLNQMNIGVVGDLGVGKTQLLKALVFNLRNAAKITQRAPLSFLIFDYKRDFQDEEFVEAVGASVLRPNRIPLNVFALRNGYSKLAANQRANMFCDVLDKIYGGVGPVQRNNLVEVISRLYEDASGTPPTLAAVLDAYKATIPRADAVVSVLNTFVLGEIFSDDPAELVPFEQLIHDRVLVIALNDLGADQNGKNALVALFLNVYFDYMQSATKWPFEGTAPKLRTLNSFLLVDEAVNIMRYNFPVLMDIMLQGREFGVGTILASQYLGHFRNSQHNYGEPLLTWFIHKVPNVSDRELAQLGINGMPAGTGERIAQLGVHEALYRSLGFPGSFIRGTPFYEAIAMGS
ncbi:hypothetical protein ACFVAJ_10340 [Agromyces sp. NPDC057679]|uniref:hypothetical protein n=1 Tax=Agromyces sp. NPDC057679 TaxID=3346207 RepID=UPI00366AED60